MDSAGVFYTQDVGSIPTGRTERSIMGKVEDLRKMREARYENRKKSTVDRTLDRSLILPGMIAPAQPKKDALCGHKGVGGKTCTRPKDHAEKNHRYK